MPLWEEIHVAGPLLSGDAWRDDHLDVPVVEIGGVKLTGSLAERHRRMLFIRRYAFAVPTPASIDRIGNFAEGGPILELGAGRGLWAHLLRAAGQPVIATDPWRNAEQWTDVACADAIVALERQPADVLMFIWPSLGRPWAADALRRFEGRQVMYIGEGRGGCTADDAFHDFLAVEFTEVATFDIPQWLGVHDRLHFYER
jgi:hypothetical protein